MHFKNQFKIKVTPIFSATLETGKGGGEWAWRWNTRNCMQKRVGVRMGEASEKLGQRAF